MKIKYIIYLTLFSFLFSCKNGDKVLKDMILTVPEDFDVSEKTICLDDICSQIKIISLETNPDLLINVISKVCLYHDILFVFHDCQISCFDMDGKFLRKIGNRGVGPGEFTDLPDGVAFCDDYVYLSNKNTERIAVYTIQGEFVRSFKTGCQISQLKVLNNKLLLGYVPNSFGNVLNKLYVYNEAGQVVDSVKNQLIYEDFQMFVHLSQEQPLFLTENNTIGFKEIFCDTIFTISPDLTFTSIGRIDLGDLTPNPDDIYKSKDINQLLTNLNKMRILEILYDNSNFMIFNAKLMFTCAVWDKKANSFANVRFVYNAEMAKLFNKEKEYRNYKSTQFMIKDGTPNFMPRYVSEDNQYLITSETSATNEDDNPIIVLARMK